MMKRKVEIDFSTRCHSSVVPAKRGGLNRWVQHYQAEVYLPEFESPKFVAGVD